MLFSYSVGIARLMTSFQAREVYSITLSSSASIRATIMRFVNFPIIPRDIWKAFAIADRDAPFPYPKQYNTIKNYNLGSN